MFLDVVLHFVGRFSWEIKIILRLLKVESYVTNLFWTTPFSMSFNSISFLPSSSDIAKSSGSESFPSLSLPTYQCNKNVNNLKADAYFNVFHLLCLRSSFWTTRDSDPVESFRAKLSRLLEILQSRHSTRRLNSSKRLMVDVILPF